MNKILKFIKFTIFAVLITVLIGTIGVEAKTCVYDYEHNGKLRITGGRTEYDAKFRTHAVFDISNSSNGSMVLSKNDSYTQVLSANWNGKEEIEIPDAQKKRQYTVKGIGTFLKTETGACPTIYIHPDSYNTNFYAAKKDCKNFIFSCSDKSLYAVEGKLEYEENDQKECTQQEKDSAADQFTNDIARYSDLIQKNIDNYKIRIVGAVTATGRSDEAMTTEINEITSGFSNYVDQATDGIVNTVSKYDCLTQGAIDSELDYINKIGNDATDELNRFKDTIIDQEAERRKSMGEDASGLEAVKNSTTEYANSIKEQYASLIERAKERAKELNLGGFNTIISPNCNNVLGNVVDIIQQVFDWIKIIAPIMLILYGSMDYAKAVIANDNDALKKATNNFVKRAIAAVVIFFLPFLINLLLSLPGIKDEINMGRDPLCGVSKVVIK